MSDDFFDPTEPFSEDEFIAYNNKQLRSLDVGRNPDAPCRALCPDCGVEVVFDEDDDEAECQNCGCEFDVN